MENKIIFRKLSVNDFDKLYMWCQEKDVYTWFEQRKLTYDEVKKKYLKKLGLKEQELYIINCDNIDIGLIQIYPFVDKDYLSEYGNKKGYEFDLFIGNVDYLSKGIGRKVIHLVVEKIIKEKDVDYIVLRPFNDNIRAIKCYEKCGFRKIKDYYSCDTIGNKKVVCIYVLENKVI